MKEEKWSFSLQILKLSRDDDILKIVLDPPDFLTPPQPLLLHAPPGSSCQNFSFLFSFLVFRTVKVELCYSSNHPLWGGTSPSRTLTIWASKVGLPPLVAVVDDPPTLLSGWQAGVKDHHHHHLALNQGSSTSLLLFFLPPTISRTGSICESQCLSVLWCACYC